MTTIQDELRDQRWNSLRHYAEKSREAADYIDKLEAALSFITDCYEYGASASGKRYAINQARAALEGEA